MWHSALRVVPGSHTRAVHDGIRRFLATMETLPAEDAIERVPAVVCPSTPADAIAIDLRLWHASAHGGAGRRLCTFEYFASPRSREEEAAAIEVTAGLRRSHFRREVRRHRRLAAEGARNVEPIVTRYSQEWINDVPPGPHRQRWLDALRRWHAI